MEGPDALIDRVHVDVRGLVDVRRSRLADPKVDGTQRLPVRLVTRGGDPGGGLAPADVRNLGRCVRRPHGLSGLAPLLRRADVLAQPGDVLPAADRLRAAAWPGGELVHG